MTKVKRPDYDVLLRALRMRVHNHATERCACDFCSVWRRLAPNAGSSK